MEAQQLAQITQGYMEAMLWAEYDANEAEPQDCLDAHHDPGDIADESAALISEDVKTFTEGAMKRGLITIDGDSFWIANDSEYDGIGGSLGRLGHDIHMTRQGHGVGFWDRGYGPNGDALSSLAQEMGATYCWVEDGRVHMERG